MATTMKVQVPTETPARFEQTERFRVEAVGPKGEIVLLLEHRAGSQILRLEPAP